MKWETKEKTCNINGVSLNAYNMLYIDRYSRKHCSTNEINMK